MIPLKASLRSYDSRAVSDETGVATGSVTLVQQSFQDEVDINTIVRRFGLTRSMPSGVAGGVYGDFSGISDFDSAVAAIERAREGFMTLGPAVRERFGNDPGQLVAFAQAATEEQFQAALAEPVAPVAPVVMPAVPGTVGG